ncbi:MAG: sigma-70 family RNA polymerase sigma factor [Methanomassiliicoccales archaeon]|jgi:RNA polymerase sigma factor (sigma-70 family)
MTSDKYVTGYCDEIGQYALLTTDREKELALIIKKSKDEKHRDEARHELIHHNLRLVVKIAFGYSRISSVPVMDLISAGNIGLTTAVDKFNPQKYHTKFSTYAVHWIKQAIRRCMHAYSHHVHVPMHITEKARKYSKMVEASRELQLTDIQCMRELAVTANGFQKIQESKVSFVPLDRPINFGDGEDTITHADVIADEQVILPSEEVAAKDIMEVMNKALNSLDAMSRDIVVSQYMASEKVELRSLGKKYGLSGERIRQIKEAALEDLKIVLHRKHMIGSANNGTKSCLSFTNTNRRASCFRSR